MRQAVFKLLQYVEKHIVNKYVLEMQTAHDDQQ